MSKYAVLLVKFHVCFLQATDADTGINSQLAYNITGGDEKHRFHVNGIGDVLSTDIAIGRAGTVYNLNVTATDNLGQGSTSLQPAKVKVRNIFFVFIVSFQFVLQRRKWSAIVLIPQ